MPHSRNVSSADAPKGPHSVSLKVLRLSKPSLANQFPLPSTSSNLNGRLTSSSSFADIPHVPTQAALVYPSAPQDAFAISPLLTLPPSFGPAYIGETFACTLCANNEIDNAPSDTDPTASTSGSRARARSRSRPRSASAASSVGSAGYVDGRRKLITGVQLAATMQTPSHPGTTAAGAGAAGAAGGAIGGGIPLDLESAPVTVRGSGRRLSADEARTSEPGRNGEIELAPGASVQRIVRFELREEGNHVLAVTVTYTETLAGESVEEGEGQGGSLAPAASGTGAGQSRVRTFRKLYQFVAQPLVGVRTKAGGAKGGWVLEAQLENLGEGALSLEAVKFVPKPPFHAQSLNWDVLPPSLLPHHPILKPRDIMQVMFSLDQRGKEQPEVGTDGRPILGQLSLHWRSAMGEKGTLMTGFLSGKKR